MSTRRSTRRRVKPNNSKSVKKKMRAVKTETAVLDTAAFLKSMNEFGDNYSKRKDYLTDSEDSESEDREYSTNGLSMSKNYKKESYRKGGTSRRFTKDREQRGAQELDRPEIPKIGKFTSAGKMIEEDPKDFGRRHGSKKELGKGPKKRVDKVLESPATPSRPTEAKTSHKKPTFSQMLSQKRRNEQKRRNGELGQGTPNKGSPSTPERKEEPLIGYDRYSAMKREKRRLRKGHQLGSKVKKTLFQSKSKIRKSRPAATKKKVAFKSPERSESRSKNNKNRSGKMIIEEVPPPVSRRINQSNLGDNDEDWVSDHHSNHRSASKSRGGSRRTKGRSASKKKSKTNSKRSRRKTVAKEPRLSYETKYTNMLDNQVSSRFQDPYDRALFLLKDSYIPESILCRDKEKEQIYEFLRKSIQNNGNNEGLCKQILLNFEFF